MLIRYLFIALVLAVGVLKAQNLYNNSSNESPGECLYLEQCPFLYQMLSSSGKTQDQIQNRRYRICDKQRGISWMCNIDPLTNIQPTTTLQPEPNDSTSILPNVCGRTVGVIRMFGAKESVLYTNPWSALVEYRNNETNIMQPLCEGSLITSRHVLTTAQCVTVLSDSTPPAQIRLGDYDLTTQVDCVTNDLEGFVDCNDSPMIVPVASYKAHEEYSKYDVSHHNDIGIIKMARTVQFSYFIRPICLPSEEAIPNLEAGSDVFVAGWGKTESGYLSNVKRDNQTTIASKASCQQVFNRNGVKLTLIKGQICAGAGQDIATCKGNSGGPLMQISKQTKLWEVVGIFSFGPAKCVTTGVPGVYTNMAEYIPWIKSQLQA